MVIDNENIVEFADLIAGSVVAALKKEGLIGTVKADKKEKNKPTEKTAYQKTEQLLYNYLGFKKIVAERMEEIEQIKKYGVPGKSGSIVEYSSRTGTVGQIVLPEETVESAIANVRANVQGTVDAIALIDKCMAALRNDPYYPILEMRYFEGRTQEDIALELKCSQVTISHNKNRLVKELSMRLFPNQVIGELLS